MKKGEFSELLKRLASDLRGMDLPPGKHTPTQTDNLRWLAKHLAARNSEHVRFKDACATLAKLGHPVAGAPAA